MASRQPNDRLGWSTDIQLVDPGVNTTLKDIAVLGAPYEDRALDEIQAIQTEGGADAFVSEVQTITSIGMVVHEVQRIVSFAQVGQSLRRVKRHDGNDIIPHFRLTWNNAKVALNTPPDTHGGNTNLLVESLAGIDVPILPNTMIVIEPIGAAACAIEPKIVYTTSATIPAGARTIPLATVLTTMSTDRNDRCQVQYKATTRLIEADASATQLAVVLQEDLKTAHNTALHGFLDTNGIGFIDVTRTSNEFACGCDGGYIWDVTFRTARGYLPLFEVDTSEMNVTSSFASVVVERIKASTILSGSFILSMPVFIHKGYNNNVQQPRRASRALHYNATAEEVRAAVAEDLWPFTSVVVTRSNPDHQRGYIWSVTYVATREYYDPPLLIADKTNLGGYGGAILAHTLTPGKAPVGGTFRLSFREHPGRHRSYGEWATTTTSIPWNASAAEMKVALENLETITSVDVTRRDMQFAGGYTWTVTFKKVADFDEGVYPYRDDPDLKQFSYLADSVGNLVPLVANETMLTGTEAKVTIHAVWNTTDLSDDDVLSIVETTNPSSHLEVARRAQRGSHGQRAGAAYVFTRDVDRWPQEYKLIGHDTDSYDRFGSAVSVSGELAAVGAPGAENYGSAGTKSIVCHASKGYFSLTYEEQTTMPFNAATTTVGSFLTGLNSMSSLGRVDVVDATGAIDTSYASQLLCNDTSTLKLTYRISSPRREELTDADVRHFTVNVRPQHLSELETKGGSIASVVITTESKAQGLSNLQVGAVYIFKRDGATGAWNEQIKLMPNSGMAGDDFGARIVLRGNTLIVAAVEDDRDGDGSGAVYHFYKQGGKWVEMQKLGYLDHECGLGCYYSTTKYLGLQFGYSIALQGDTLIVGGYPKTKALRQTTLMTLYVYKRNGPGKNFLPEQLLKDPKSHIGDGFGSSISVHENTLVVGSPYRKTNSAAEGAVIVYERLNVNQLFELQQYVYPVDSKSNDRFGQSVSVEFNTLIAAYHEEFPLTKWTIRKSVQSVTTSAKSTIAGNFYITWRVKQNMKPSSGLYDEGHPLDIIKEGTRVEARFGGEGTGLLNREPIDTPSSKWYPGRVTRAPKSVGNTDGTYGIQYENGLWEPDVTRDRIRRLGALKHSDDFRGKYRIVKTSRLSHDITASSLRDKLQRELGTGLLFVDRMGPDTNGGFTWRVTFQDFGTETIPLLGGRADGLTGKHVQVRTKVLSKPMINMRKGTVVFIRDSQFALWREQAILAPASHQGTDLFGAHQLNVRGTFAIVSAANRDSLSSGVNSGGAFMFNLDFLSLSFGQKSYSFSESSVGGGKHNISVTRCSPKCHYGSNNYDAFVEYQIGDGDSTGLPKILSGPQLNLRGACPFAKGCSSSATGRADCLTRSAGLEECLWVPSNGKLTHAGIYDVLGLSDYAPVYGSLAFGNNISSTVIAAVITDDDVVETPNEFFNVRLLAPGFQPSFGGNLWSTVTIEDDGDGGIGTETYFDILEPSSDSRAHDKFGYALAAKDSSAQTPTAGMFSPSTIEANDGLTLAVGAPYVDTVVGNDTAASTGRVYVYTKSSATGVWSRVQEVTRPGVNVPNAFFGMSVSLYNDTMLIGAPGVSRAYVYRFNVTIWIFEAELMWSEIDTTAQFGGVEGVAVWGKWAVVGAKGAEAAFVYKFFGGAWQQWQRLRTDYQETTILRTTYRNHGDFGASVAIWSDTLVIGAPKADHGHQIFSDHYGTGNISGHSEAVVHLRQGMAAHSDDRHLSVPDGLTLAVPPHSEIHITNVGHAKCSIEPKIVYADSVGAAAGATTIKLATSLTTLTPITRDLTDECQIMYTATEGGGRPTEKGFHGRGIVYQYLINSTSGKWELQTRLQASDKQAQDNFGASVAIDQDYIVVGAPDEDVKARTTWDFEMGNLMGWHKTGTAFDYQPTLGDNTDARDIYGHIIMTGDDTTYYPRKYYAGEGDTIYQQSEGVPLQAARDPAGEKEYLYTESVRLPTYAYKGNPTQNSNKVGKYWIGTYEKRPNVGYPMGTVQGDGPTGTLTSDPFMIAGTEISFLVGGGCRINEVWVELFIDGESGYFPSYKAPNLGGMDTGEPAIPVYRVTGKCSESMDRVRWRVGQWKGRMGQIRIVDMSTKLWAHINVDDFRFDWDNEPASMKGAGNIEPCDQGQCGHSYGESSGAAYVYRRVNKPKHSLVFPPLITPISPGTTLTITAPSGSCSISPKTVVAATEAVAGDRLVVLNTTLTSPSVVGDICQISYGEQVAALKLGTPGAPSGSFFYFNNPLEVAIPAGSTVSIVDGSEGYCSVKPKSFVTVLGAAVGATSLGLSIVMGSSSQPGDWCAIKYAPGTVLSPGGAAAPAVTGLVNGIVIPELCQQFCDSNGCFFNGYTEGWGGEVGDVDRWQCYWREEQKLQASDKRERDHFGQDVSVDFGTGTVLVGAPESRIVDLFNRNFRTGRLQTNWRPSGGFDPRVPNPNIPSGGGSGAGHVWGFGDDDAWRSGAVYMFTRWPEGRAGDGRVVEISAWNVTEKVKFQSPNKLDRDHMGFSVASVGYEGFAGSPREPSSYAQVFKQVGAVTYFNLRLDRVRFRDNTWKVTEYSSEQDPHYVDVYLDRVGDLSKRMDLQYATSDITAMGTPQKDFEICMQYYKSERGECGDYVEQTGTVTFAPGAASTAIRLYIVDDFCPERFDEVFKISLFLPGGDVLTGKEYAAFVVIEDDDQVAGRLKSVAYCKRQSPVYSEI